MKLKDMDEYLGIADPDLLEDISETTGFTKFHVGNFHPKPISLRNEMSELQITNPRLPRDIALLDEEEEDDIGSDLVSRSKLLWNKANKRPWALLSNTPVHWTPISSALQAP